MFRLSSQIIRFLPPANEVCEGYVFTGVCHSVHGGGGGVRGFFDEIRSMSGRYASYWNAFLFRLRFQLLFGLIFTIRRSRLHSLQSFILKSVLYVIVSAIPTFRSHSHNKRSRNTTAPWGQGSPKIQGSPTTNQNKCTDIGTLI